MNLKTKIAIVTTILTLLFATFIMGPVFSVDPDPDIEPAGAPNYERYGPRVDDLMFSVWGDVLGESEALNDGDIDTMDWAAPASYIEPGGPAEWWTDADVTLGNYSEWGFYEHDINCQMWPIGHGNMTPQGYTLPADYKDGHNASDPNLYWIDYTCQKCLDARQFRRALAHLTDRGAMVANMKGYAAPMETFCFPGISAWENPDAPKYAYDTAAAEAALLAGGFKDWDSDDIMEYSPGHDGNLAELWELPTLMGYIRSDDPDRTFAGILLRNELIKLGIPQNFVVESRAECYYHAWVVYDYHVYTGGWGWGRVPDMYCDLWHSSKDIYPSAGGDNYNRYHSLEYDPVAWGLKMAATSEAAKPYCDACQMIIHRDVACIPTYTFAGFTARRTKYMASPPSEEEPYADKPWEGFCNELGSGYYSLWNPLNAHPQGFMKGGTFRQGLLVDIEKWSPVHAEWFYDWLVLWQIYESLIAYHPQDATKFVGVLAQDVPEELTWEFGGETCTRLRFKLCPGIRWHDLSLGACTPEDVGWSFLYLKNEVSVSSFFAVQFFETYATSANATVPWGDKPGPDEVDICFNVLSWLALEWASAVPIIPKAIWEGKESGTWNPEEHDAVIGTGPFMCNKDGVPGKIDYVQGQYVHLEANPYYYCKYVWPDVCTTDPGSGTPVRDGIVKIVDFGTVAFPGRIFTYDTRLFPTLPSWPSNFVVDSDQYLDVDKNGAIDVNDLIEIGVAFGKSWPPSYYEWVETP